MHNMEKCGREKDGLKGARYARIAAGDLRLAPPFSPASMLRHVVYASLLHFGVETAWHQT